MLSGWPGKAFYQLICLGFLGFGLVRLGAGSAALLQMAGWVEFAEITEALIDVERFMAEHADQSLADGNLLLPCVADVGLVALGKPIERGQHHPRFCPSCSRANSASNTVMASR